MNIDLILKQAERRLERRKSPLISLDRDKTLDVLLGEPKKLTYHELCKGISDALDIMDTDTAKRLLAALSDEVDLHVESANGDRSAGGVPSEVKRVKNGARETYDPFFRTWLRDQPKGRR